MSHFYLIHGFNERAEGHESVGMLRRGLEERGHTAVLVRYGWVHRIRVRLCNSCLAKAIASLVNQKPGHVIAFSNGAAITYKAAKEGAMWDRAFLINPALNAKLAIPHVRKVDVFYSKSDHWTKLARFIPASIWGRQGAIGYTGDDPEGRYSQLELDKLAGRETKHGGILDTHHDRELLLSIIQASLDKDQ